MPSVRKKRVLLTASAPHVSTKGVSGKGGGIIAGSANAMAPLRRTRRLTCSSRRADTKRSSPCSPARRPIQNVIAPPISDPAVAIAT